MEIEQDMRVIEEQESVLQFSAFSADLAWEIGSRLRADALARKAGMTFEIQIAGRPLFVAATNGAKTDQPEWIRRKRNSVMRFGRSTYWLSLELTLKGKRMDERHEGIGFADYAMHGGGFPIVLRETGCVGSIIASGLHQRVDHAMVVDAIASALGVEVPRLDP